MGVLLLEKQECILQSGFLARDSRYISCISFDPHLVIAVQAAIKDMK